jgi:hypothetical protein
MNQFGTYRRWCSLLVCLLISISALAIDWDKIGSMALGAVAAALIKFSFDELNRYREQTHKNALGPAYLEYMQETHTPPAQEQKDDEYKRAFQELKICIELHNVVQNSYKNSAMLQQQSQRCVELSGTRAEALWHKRQHTD